MRKLLAILAVALLAVLAAVSTAPAQEAGSSGEINIQYATSDTGIDYVPGELVVSKKNTDEVKVVSTSERGYAGLQRAAEALQSQKGSEYVVAPNTVYHTAATPDDTRYDDQYYLRDIAAPAAWNTEKGAGASVCVVDEGYAHDNTDLDNKVVDERDALNQDGVANDSNSSHGTMVSGVAAAETNNNNKVAGVAWSSNLRVVKIFDADGDTTTDAIVRGLQACQNLGGSSVINMSWGGYGFNAAINNEVQERWLNGFNLVAAAGNHNNQTSDFYPCAYDNVICVSATNEAGNKASFSNYGASIDLAAPGTNIVVLANTSTTIIDGTSFSAPQVSGAAALLRARGFTRAETRDRLFNNARDYAPAGKDNVYGHGFLSVNCAVTPGDPGC